MNDVGEIREKLFDSASVILEDMRFMIAEEDAGNRRKSEQPESIAVISFDGPISGEMVIKAYGDILFVIGCNMIGEEEVPNDMEHDSLGKFANILVGNFIPALSGPGSFISIQHPEVIKKDEYLGEYPETDHCVNMVFKNGELVILLYAYASERA